MRIAEAQLSEASALSGFSDIQRPRQADSKHPQLTDHRDGDRSELGVFEDAGIQDITPKRAGPDFV